MKARRLLAVSRKEFLHVRRDSRSLGLGIAIPVVLLLLFGYVLTLDVDRVPLAVWDRSRAPESRELVSRFEGSRYFQVALRAGGYPELEEAIDDGRVLAALVIPEEFSGRIRSDRPSTVQLLLDASEANTATIALGYAEAVVSGYSADLEVRWARAKGLQGIRPPLDVRPRVWFNTDLESRNFIIPGLISVIMMIIAALLTSLTVAREWEQGTMEQLIATPVTGMVSASGRVIRFSMSSNASTANPACWGCFPARPPMRGKANPGPNATMAVMTWRKSKTLSRGVTAVPRGVMKLDAREGTRFRSSEPPVAARQRPSRRVRHRSCNC